MNYETNRNIIEKRKARHAKALPHILSSNIRHELQAFTAEETFAIYVL